MIGSENQAGWKETARIGFIGAGRVATAFGRYLHHRKVSVGGYFDHSLEKARAAAKGAGTAACDDLAQVAARCNIILITTQDDRIAPACEELCQQARIFPRHRVGHMSGAHPAGLLCAARKEGATIFSLHPLQAFADLQKSFEALPDTFFAIEGQGDGLPLVAGMMATLGNPCFNITSENKRLYHLGACVISNFLVTLVDAGLAALERSGIDPRRGFEAMRPLIEGTLSNIGSLGTAKALTGPIARGDSGTIAGHLEALDAASLADLKAFYTFMGRRTLELAAGKTLTSEEKVAAIRRLLAD
ncbi:MAG: DUF2520 domain-containing protein [Desulfosarcinaceae bacterium]|jgi:predicted short-subunit dehydrogenase-like oxidoreductase (DUF2520 family)